MRKIQNDELARLTVDEFKLAEKRPVIIVLDDIRSLNNIGSVFRTADAFLIEAIYLCGISATPPHRDIHKTALGAEETVDWKYFNNAVEAVGLLKQNDFLIYAVEQVENSISLYEFKCFKDKKYAFVFGNEIFGVNEKVLDLCDGAIELPQHGTKHSVNVAVTTGIVSYHYCLQIKNQ